MLRKFVQRSQADALRSSLLAATFWPACKVAAFVIKPATPASRCATALQATMKFQRVEFSWRAAFLGLYLTPERDKLWVTIIPFFPLYFKRV